MQNMIYTHVIWDWNGTLLDDTDWCIQNVNVMLAKRELPVFSSVEDYHRIFGFPIIDYYRRAGFNFGKESKESFEDIAKEFIDLYHSDQSKFQLFNSAKETLAAVRNMRLKQVILSASEINNLLSQVRLLDIEHYFDEILGISNIYATSKADIGKKAYMSKASIDKTVLIGDTAHDYEVAEAIGADCILVAKGHQSKSALLMCGVPVVDDIKEVVGVIESCRV